MRSRIKATLLGVAILLSASAASGAPPADALLPSSTCGFVSIADFPATSQAWELTQLGQLAADPQMQPIVRDLRAQLHEQWLASHIRLGIEWEELRDVATGEVAVALIPAPRPKVQPGRRPAAAPLPISLLLIQVGGKAKSAQALIDKVEKNIQQQGAKRLAGLDNRIRGWNIPVSDPTTNRGQAAFLLFDDLLIAGNDAETVAAILAQWKSSKEKLQSNAAYHHVVDRCRKDAGEDVEHVRWFVSPMAFAECVKAGSPDSAGGDVDVLQVLQKQGLAALQGVGGLVHFNLEPFDSYQRVAIYAPQPWTLAMRMFQLPNAEIAPPEPWIPSDVVACQTLECDLRNAFKMSESLVDEYYGAEGVFADSLASLRDDEDGPRIDVERDLVAHLGQKILVLSSYQRPIGPESDQQLVAIEITDSDPVAGLVAKDMRGNRAVKAHTIHGLSVWELGQADSSKPSKRSDAAGRSPRRRSRRAARAEARAEVREETPTKKSNQAIMRSRWITVANGYLMISTGRELLERVLEERSDSDALLRDNSFGLAQTRMRQEASRRGWKGLCFSSFRRRDQTLELNYELARSDQLSHGDGTMARILKLLSGAAGDGLARQKQATSEPLPALDFDRHQLGPQVWLAHTEKDGWFAVGFTLPCDGPVARARKVQR